MGDPLSPRKHDTPDLEHLAEVDIDRPINTERGVFLTCDDEAGDSEETNGRTLRPFRLSGGRRQVPSAHQETEAARDRKDESEGGIHEHEPFTLGARVGYPSPRVLLCVIVGWGNDAERGVMNKKLRVSGMSCGHCVSHVKSALEGIEGVSQADVSLENHEAEVTLSGEVIDADLIAAVEAAGYQAEVR